MVSHNLCPARQVPSLTPVGQGRRGAPLSSALSRAHGPGPTGPGWGENQAACWGPHAPTALPEFRVSAGRSCQKPPATAQGAGRGGGGALVPQVRPCPAIADFKGDMMFQAGTVIARRGILPSRRPPGALKVTGDDCSSGSPSGSVHLRPLDWGWHRRGAPRTSRPSAPGG